MKKALVSVALASAFALGALAAPAQAATIRLGSTGAPGTADYQAIEVFADSVKKATDGRVDVKIYPSSELGTYKEMLEQIRAGALDGLYESLGVIGAWHPVAGLEAVPYLYRDVDHFFAVWNGDVGKAIIDDVAAKSGFRIVGPAFRGFRQMALNTPVEKVDDLAGIKFRAPAIPAYMSAFVAMGGSPTPIAFEEVYTAVQQHVVDGLENPIVTIYDHHFNEVTKYLVLTSHMAETMGFIFSEDWYQKLSDEDRAAINAAARASADWYREYTAENEGKILDTLQAGGMTVIHPDLASFRAKVADFDPGPDLRDWVAKIRSVN